MLLTFDRKKMRSTIFIWICLFQHSASAIFIHPLSQRLITGSPQRLPTRTSLYSSSEKVSGIPITQTRGVVEQLDELMKESFYCFRTPDPSPTSTCTVECKRKDGNPLGYTGDMADDMFIRRAFAFAREPASPGNSYEGPLLIHVREIPFSYGKLGGQIWYAAVGFGQYVAMNASQFKGKKILELGAGLGLPGLVAAKCGGIVTLSEFGYEGEVDGEIIEIQGEKRLIPSALLDNLRYNVLLNSPCSEENTVKVRHLDWYDYVDGSPKLSNENESKDEEYDLIIGSDLINWEDDVGPLISTLKYFLKLKEGAKAIISLSSENRRGLPMLLDRVKQEFAMVEIVEQSVVHFEEHPLVLITLSM